MRDEAVDLLKEDMRIDHTDRQMEREHVAHDTEAFKEWFTCPGCGGRVHNDVGMATGGTCPDCYEDDPDG